MSRHLAQLALERSLLLLAVEESRRVIGDTVGPLDAERTGRVTAILDDALDLLTATFEPIPDDVRAAVRKTVEP